MSTSLQNRYRPMPPASAAPADPAANAEIPLHANSRGTILALIGIFGTWLTMSGKWPTDVAHYAAVGTGLSLLVSFGFDLKLGIRNMIRADVMAIVAYYFLTLFEFLLPQPLFNTMLTVATTRAALETCLLGMAGMLIGRHLLRPKKQPFQRILTMEIPPLLLIALFWVTFAVGFFYQLLAVDFDVVKWVSWFLEPRFTQPWTRGRLGDWKALLVELGLFIYLIPPMAGIMMARRQRYPVILLVTVIIGFLFTLFYGFTGGTRNVIAAYLVTFLIAYALARPPAAPKAELVILAAFCMVAMVTCTVWMLQFRNDGFRNWWLYGPPPNSAESRNGGVYVDYNLYAMGRLCEVFPARKDYLGLEIPYTALIRPIPRALWSGKPEGLSMSIEDALGVTDLTISASFAGEAYMSGGLIAVFISGLAFGLFNGWWSSLASVRNSELGILIYSSGFFAAVISMRSMFEFTTALMPVLASFVLTFYLCSLVAYRGVAKSAKAKPRRPGMPVPRSHP